MAAKGGLGRGLNNKGKGLDSLIAPKKTNDVRSRSAQAEPKSGTSTAKSEKKAISAEKKAEMLADISLVSPNKNQPRKEFDEAALKELAESIKNYGVISPIIVRNNDGFYEIIAGERRWRAAKMAGLKKIPVIVREYDEQIAAEVALIENIQREDLNPVEEAKAYQRLIDEFSLKQEEIAQKVSKSRVFITNSLRLLKLDERVQRMLEDKLISAGHARAILGISDGDAQYEIAQKAFHNSLSVREVEKLVKNYGKAAVTKKDDEPESVKAVYQDLTMRLTEALSTKVLVNRKDNNKGRLEIYYNSMQELEELTTYLMKKQQKQ